MPITALEKQLRCLEREANCKFNHPVKKLGEGAFGCVIQGTHIRHGKRTVVAIKLAKSRPINGADPHAMLRNEYRQIRRISPPEQPHPNIVSLVLAGTMKDLQTSVETTAMIMELCTGGCLFDYQQKANYPLSRLEIIYQVCTGVAYMHHRGVYHRDLKPENILVQRTRNNEYVCKIADFGLATEKDFEVDLAGTTLYLGPESYTEPGPYNTAKGDIFALGTMFFEMLTGDVPWGTSQEKVDFIRRTEWADMVSVKFHEFFGASLIMEPDDRAAAGTLQQMSWKLWSTYGKR